MKKRLLAAILALVLVCSLLPVNVLAEGEETSDPYFYAVVNNEVVTSLTMDVGDTVTAYLYYGVPDGDTEKVTSTSYPDGIGDDCAMDVVIPNDGEYVITAYKAGTSRIVYTKDGNEYTFTVTVAGETPAPDSTKVLYAVVNSEVVTGLTMNVGDTVTAYLYYGVPGGDAEKVTSASYPDGIGDDCVVDIVIPNDGEYVITAYKAGTSRIVYTEDGKAYEFAVTVPGATNTDNPNGDEDPVPSETPTPVGKALFTRWPDGNGYMTSSELPLNGISSLVFYFGTDDDCIAVTDLTTEGVATLEASVMDGVSCYLVGVNGVGTGAVVYKDTDGTEYRYSVIGFEIPVEPALLVQVGDEFVNSLKLVGDSDGTFATISAQFAFGTEAENSALSYSDLTATGVASISAGDNGAVMITASGAGYGTVGYTKDGVTYSILLTAADANGSTGTADGSYLYAKWAGDDVNKVTELELWPDSGSPLQLFFYNSETETHEQLEGTANLRAAGIATLSYVGAMNMDGTEYEKMYHIGVNGVGEGAIVYTYDGVDYVFEVNCVESNNVDATPWYVTFDYEGKEISVGIGFIQENTMSMSPVIGDSYTEDMASDYQREIVLVALENCDGYNGTAQAPAEFFQKIKNVTFELVDATNEDGSTDPLNCSVSDTEAYHVLTVDTWKANVTAPYGKGFNATLQMSFTIDLGNGDENYTLSSGMFYQKLNNLVLDIPADAAMEDGWTLNKILASYENLMEWARSVQPEDVAAFEASSSMGDITLKLPETTYDYTVECHIGKINSGIQLVGFSEGTTTMSRGLINYSGLGGVTGIDFTDAGFEDAGEEKFGIWAVGNDEWVWLSDTYWVNGCTFTNLDKALITTDTGFVGGIGGNTFRNCKVGIYIDGDSDGYMGAANDEFTGNRFIGCDVAVWIEELPSFITHYALRICDNAFIGNRVDFHIGSKAMGRYYFYRNFYGWYMTRSEDGEATARTVIIDTEDHEVVTNPCRATENGLLMVDNTPGLHTMILEDLADELVMDGALLQENDGVTEIILLDNEENEVAVWTFGGEEE